MTNYLKNHHDLTVFTNGIEVAFRLAENRSNKVVLTGGLLRPETASLSGQFGSAMLGGVRANKAFFSCTGWSPTMELMDDDLFEAQLKKEMVDAAETIVLLMDSSKFEKQGVAAFAPMSRVNMVITDDQVGADRLSQLKHAGIAVTICSEHTTRVMEGGNGEKLIRIGFANQDDTSPFSALVRQGMVEAARIANIELLLADNFNSGPTALANADYFIHEHVDLIVEFNTDISYNNMIMERIRSAHIPVIAIDIPMPGATFVGVDNYRSGLMAGRLAGAYINQCWQGRVDKVLSLELPSSGPVPAARMQGRIDGLRESCTAPDEHIVHLDSKNTYSEAYTTVTALLPTIPSASHIIIFGINDEVTLGALAAFADAGASKRVIAVGQGTGSSAREELQRTGSRLIGSVTSFPEHYGKIIIDTALQMLQGKQVPPAVYTHHILVLSEETLHTLDLSALPEEAVSVLAYNTIPFPRTTTSQRRIKTQ